jgi:hypothetical protein
LPLGARVEQQLKLVKRDGLTEIIDTPLLSVAKLVEYGPKAIIIDRRRTLKNAFSLVAFSGCEKVISTHAETSPLTGRACSRHHARMAATCITVHAPPAGLSADGSDTDPP